MDTCFLQGWTCPSDTRFPPGHTWSQRDLGSMRIHCVTMFALALGEPNVLTIDPCFLKIPVHHSDLLGPGLSQHSLVSMCFHCGTMVSSIPCKRVDNWFHEFSFHQDDLLHSLRTWSITWEPLFPAGCQRKKETTVTYWDPMEQTIDSDTTETQRSKSPW